ncbi:MAG: ABC transporter ATP-binding protein [Firmicutes bacterium]|nr:ABC transporter ATP-binding protein [Bacillota bacterium]
MNNILNVQGLRKSFGNFKLQDVSFSLKEGCITGFIGANGAGKTTTIKSILGLILKDAGSVKLFGKEISTNEREIKNRIGIVLDNGYFYNDMTLIEMKSIIASAYSNWDEKIFLKYIEKFNLPLKQKISNLSKGMRMKYSIALALSHKADLLIMDEPTSGLDPLIRTEIMDILLEFMEKEGKSIFFSSHITSDLDKISDVLILIDDGRIVFNKEKDKLLDTHGLIKGDNALLNNDTKKLFLKLHETEYGFEGLTNNKEAVREQMKDVLIEKPTIENIMLGYIGGENYGF